MQERDAVWYNFFMINWDYELPTDWKPKTDKEWEWFLVRKINYDDLQGLKKTMIKQHFPAIKKFLDPGKKAMLEHFFANETN